MQASTKTLDNMIAQLPLVMQRRYDPNVLGVALANEILGEIEREVEADFLVKEFGILTKTGVTDYVLPGTVRQIRGLYPVPAGDVYADKDDPQDFEVRGSTLRLVELPTISSDADISGTVTSSPPADKSKVYDATVGKLDQTVLTTNKLISRLIKVTHANGTIEWRVLKGNTPASGNGTADINGELDAQAAAGDAYLISKNFLVLEAVKYFTRLTVSTGVLDIPQDFELLFRAGLHHRYHMQSDELSTEAKAWGEQYYAQLQKYGADVTRIRGTAQRNKPRSMPGFQ